ncbi:MAG: hypothetical protein Q8L46_02490 [candidate division WWE3 bacterium]|nr:hypothetical protein [candidate division WWE3 bacterium]
MLYAEVAVDTYQDPARKLFTYSIPEDLRGLTREGVKVSVPFGKRVVEGFVWSTSNRKPPFPTKDIQAVKGPVFSKAKARFDAGRDLRSLTKSLRSFVKPSFSKTQIELAKWMAKRYLASPRDCLKCQIPGKGERVMIGNPKKVTTLLLLPYASQVSLSSLPTPGVDSYGTLVGSRSAVFAPLPNLKKIVIEEPENWNYKDERAPYYHAAEVAQKRAEIEKLSLELRYQTPRVEDYKEISERSARGAIGERSEITINGKALISPTSLPSLLSPPSPIIIDLNREKLAGNFTFVSQPMEAALSSRKYSLVYVNSRELREGIKEELRKLGPDKNFYKVIGPELFALPGQEAFHTIWADVDTLLNLPDFRAHEKIVWTVQKLNQLTKGKLFLQTSSPENPLFKNLESGPLDVAQGRPERSRMGGQLESFYRRELENRKKFSLPPFATLVKLSYSAKSSTQVHLEAEGLYESILNLKSQTSNLEISPPYEPYAKTPGKVQLNIAVKLKNKGAKQKEETLDKLSKTIPPDWKVEVDPESLL